MKIHLLQAKILPLTEDLRVSEKMVIQSHKGPYTVIFDDAFLCNLDSLFDSTPHFLVDANVARLYSTELALVLKHPNTVLIDATEENKSIERVIPVIEKLVANKARRDHSLVGIGGGIIQDITCFIASTLLRGMRWKLVPTTLLAQADSCIGSKSSINLGSTKNILGTFNPPNEIFICPRFIDTLEHKDILSGIGEMLKVHAIEGKTAFDKLANDYEELLSNRQTLLRYIRDALHIKQKFIEVDEFDRGIRNIFNYGHSFGHAIESATNFAIPHGIAVTIGMDMANRIAMLRGLLAENQYRRMHGVLQKNYAEFAHTPIAVDALVGALIKDKKNTATKLVLIFPLGDNAKIERVNVEADNAFRSQCSHFLKEMAT
jgi:3-dehydroquinate synthase